MRPDVDAMAAEVVLLVKSSLAPVQADVKALQGQIAAWEARWGDIGALRERVAVMEVKAAPAPPQPVVVPDLAPLEARLAALETKELPPGRDGKDGEPGVAGEKGLDGAPGQPGERGGDGPEGKPGRDGRDGLHGVPGVAGEKGLDGTHGLNGTDGLGFDGFEELYDGERTFTHRYHQGDRVKEYAWKTSMEIYRGVWVEGKTYERGDRATWGGSEWHCNELTTTKPGDGSKAWTLAVKRGRDGKDGRDVSPPAVPVVRIR